MTDEKTEEKIDVIPYFCSLCDKFVDPCDWNAYYGICNPCVDNSGRS